MFGAVAGLLIGRTVGLGLAVPIVYAVMVSVGLRARRRTGGWFDSRSWEETPTDRDSQTRPRSADPGHVQTAIQKYVFRDSGVEWMVRTVFTRPESLDEVLQFVTKTGATRFH